MTVQELARLQAEAQAQATQLTQMLASSDLSQLAARRLLTPPGSIRHTEKVTTPLLCQAPGMDCLPGEEVRCEIGRHAGCDCEYIRVCFPRAAECSHYNATHVTTCGF
ncbi:hypothetical protein KC19_2G205900 [Ceratodon purpureus]|uniref:Uncharacterized protein n=1 Tax=Ceratodon purpureus TaxID=3225 RepID=A0A8T0IW76_CERPU|nr:hypothetical protein KC19_2G205900 [Ceratodon purpureus]